MTSTYYIYKLRVKGSKLFYIGVTNNIEHRKRAHFSTICGVAIGLRFIRQKPIDTRLLAHYTMAKAIVKGKKASDINKSFVYSKLSISVMTVGLTIEDAIIIENRFIKKYSTNPNFLNVDMVSRYSNKKKPLPKPAKNV